MESGQGRIRRGSHDHGPLTGYAVGMTDRDKQLERARQILEEKQQEARAKAENDKLVAHSRQQDDLDPRATSVRRDVEWWRRYPLDVISVESDAPDRFALESVKSQVSRWSRTSCSVLFRSRSN